MVANVLSKKEKRKAAKKEKIEIIQKLEDKIKEGEETTAQSKDQENEVDSEVEEEEEEEEEEEGEEEGEEGEQEEEEEEEEEEEDNKKKDYINDKEALQRLTNKIKLAELPWIETMEITSSKPIKIDESHQDENVARELAFYQQALEAAYIARDKFKQLDVPFSRPDDYFAEMLKSDEHMAKIRQRLLDEAAKNKAAEDKKRQRNLKKFGKKVQIEKQLERQREKTQTLDKIKLLKRKRKENGQELTLDNDFDIALESADKKRQKTDKKTNKPTKRDVKNAKYGFGGKRGKHHKSNTAESSAGIGGYNKKGKGTKRGRK